MHYVQIDVFMQKRRNSTANALELRPFCINSWCVGTKLSQFS